MHRQVRFPFSDLLPGDRLEVNGDECDFVAIVCRVLPSEVIVALVDVEAGMNESGTGDICHLMGTLDFHEADRPFESIFSPGEFVTPNAGRLLGTRVEYGAMPYVWVYNNVRITRGDDVIHATPDFAPRVKG